MKMYFIELICRIFRNKTVVLNIKRHRIKYVLVVNSILHLTLFVSEL